MLDDGAWRDDLTARFLDAEGSLCFGWEYQVVHAYAVNTGLVREGEIGTVHDLLDPTWRGRILSSDPRVGTALLSAASVARRAGADVLRRLLVDQRPALSREAGRSVAEPLVRGRYPVALGCARRRCRSSATRGWGTRCGSWTCPTPTSRRRWASCTSTGRRIRRRPPCSRTGPHGGGAAPAREQPADEQRAERRPGVRAGRDRDAGYDVLRARPGGELRPHGGAERLVRGLLGSAR